LAYRTALGETGAKAPLASRLYRDETLLRGVTTASQLSSLPAKTLMQEYGRSFIVNG